MSDTVRLIRQQIVPELEYDIDGPYPALETIVDDSPVSSSIIKVGRLNNRLIATLPSQMCRDLGIVVGCEMEWRWKPGLGNGPTTLKLISTPKSRSKFRAKAKPQAKPKRKKCHKLDGYD